MMCVWWLRRMLLNLSAVGSVLLLGGPAHAVELSSQFLHFSSLLPLELGGDNAVTGLAIDEQAGQLADRTENVQTSSAFSALPVVGDAELSETRGGFLTANGIEFDFGANIQTLVNGQLALQTTVQWSSAGATVQQLSGSGTNIVAVPSAQLTALFGTTNGIVTSGVQIAGPSGSTEVAANVAGNQIQNLVANSANNQGIIQNTAVTLAIYNFAAWQQQLTQHALAAQFATGSLPLGLNH